MYVEEMRKRKSKEKGEREKVRECTERVGERTERERRGRERERERERGSFFMCPLFSHALK